ncbi:MAG: hypothetical protein LCH38_04995 [Proteobacteria bacterium]|nr:hypothetical protein [Pseudomonadota bacterium]
MADKSLLSAIFARYGVSLTEEEATGEAGHAPREAILLLLANREISARFDAAHGRTPDENDVDELLDIYEALEAKKAG